MKAGRRFFPFTLKDQQGRALTSAVLEINHIVHEQIDVIPLSDVRFLIPDTDLTLSFLLRNKGSVPVEFKTADYKYAHIVQPGRTDTLVVNLEDVQRLERTEFWVSLQIDYILTTILPNDLIAEHHTIHRFIPIASRSRYPEVREYLHLPINVSQSYHFEESNYSFVSQSHFHRTHLWGHGYVDEYPSPFLSWDLRYHYDDFDHQTRQSLRYNALYRSQTLSFSAGENSYLLDTRHTQKYGEGFDLSYNLFGAIFQKAFVKELYKDRPVHNSIGIGYTWDTDSYMYEPQQYIRARHYQKNNRHHDNKWYIPGSHESIEHQKIVLDTRFKLWDKLQLHLEVYSAEDDFNANFTNPAFSTELFFATNHFRNVFSLLRDNLDIKNETKYNNRYQNDMSINFDIFDMYASYQYHEQLHQPTWSVDREHYSNYFYANIYYNFYKNLYLRTKAYNSTTKITLPSNVSYTSSEKLLGAMYKNNLIEIETLAGIRTENFSFYSDEQHPIFDINFAASRSAKSTFHLMLNNRLHLKEDETAILSYLTLFNRFSPVVSQSFGLYNTFYSENDWKNSLSTFITFFFRLPWKHDFRVGSSFNFNPTYAENYRYTISAEYNIPLNLNLIPTPKKKYMIVSVFDPWQKKPVSGAVFNIDNRYFVTNQDGFIRPRKSDIQNKPIQIINLPDGFTTTPDVQSIPNMKGHATDIRIINYSQLAVYVRKITYEHVSPRDIDRFQNLAYFRDAIVNLDRSTVVDCYDPIEVVLKNIHNPADIHRGLLLQSNVVVFDRLTQGTYEISINPFVLDDLIFEGRNNIITIGANQKAEHNLILRERVTRFIRFD
jgi:hypothetical protein